MIRKFRLFLLTALTLTVLLSCTTAQAPPARPEAVEEIHEGILMGYLEADEYPDSLALLPPPPEEGSAAYAKDMEVADDAAKYIGTPRWELAGSDADLHFPHAAGTFTEALGFEITDEETPWTYQIMRRVLADGGFSTYAAKNHYQRHRPFMVNNRTTAFPEDEEELRSDGSYPSGHTAVGWTWALVLSELVPGKTDAILARGYEFGESRIVANYHWRSDVDAGRIVAAAAVARLHADEEFLAAMEAAKAELSALGYR